MRIRTNRLPYGYKELEYIESTGTQYINFQFPSASNIDVTANVLHTDGTNEQILWGEAGIQFLYTITAGWKVWKQGVGNVGIGALGTQHTFTIKTTASGVEYYVDGVKNTSVSANLFTSSSISGKEFNIGARTTSGGADYFWKGKIYSVQIAVNGTLVRNFIPAKNSSNVAGLFDTVSGTFFTNDGTGTFVAGPDL